MKPIQNGVPRHGCGPIKKGVENDAEFATTMRFIANDLSTNVFNSQPVDMHLCDEFFNTIRVVTQ
jgi:hypothetical protein